MGVPYKAIVLLYLFGGLDSFNVLAPSSKCTKLFNEYTEARGGLGLTDATMTAIDARSSDQPCDVFGVSNLLSSYREIYEAGDGIFFANMGHLSKIVNKKNWRGETEADVSTL